MLHLLVVDDHPLVRNALTQAFADEFPLAVVHQAGKEAEAIQYLHKHNLKLIVLDLSLPGRGGLELLKDMKTAQPETPVLILSSYPESQFALRCLRAGASGYLTKESTTGTLMAAARQLMTGGRYITPVIADLLAESLGANISRPPHELLSDREYEVMIRMAKSETPAEIAESLNLSVKTVATYRTRILSKTLLKNNAQVMEYAIRRNLV